MEIGCKAEGVVKDIGTEGMTMPDAEVSLEVSGIGCGGAMVTVCPTVVKTSDAVSMPPVEPGDSAVTVGVSEGPWVKTLSVTMGVVVTGTALVLEIIGGMTTVLVIMPPVDPDVMVITVSVGIEGFGTLGIELADAGRVTTVVSGMVPVDPNVIVATVMVGSDVLGTSVA